MKKQILPILGLLLGLALVGCNKNAPAGGSSSAGSSSGQKSNSGSTSSSRHTHTYAEEWSSDENNHWHAATCGHDVKSGNAAHSWVKNPDKQSKDATCKEAGYEEQICSVCKRERRLDIPRNDLLHTWGNPTVVEADGATKYTKKTCTTCGAVDIVVDALGWVKMEGSNKDSSGATLKFATNGDNADYAFNLDKALTGGKVYLYGWVDYWKDGSNNNDQRGFNSRKSGDGWNFELTVNGQLVEITNTKTYEQMGMTEGVDGNGSFTLCEVGAAALAAGNNIINYKRIESYNLNITEFHFIGTVAA